VLEPERSPAKHALNVDGAFILDTCVGAVGAVVRGTRTFRVVSARWLCLVGSALLAEAEALREGL